MATYSPQQLADYYGVSKRTFERHLKILKDRGAFKKTSIGDNYNETDSKQIAMLLGFSIPIQPVPPPIPPNPVIKFKFT